jgi:hypothetical protein
MGWKLRGQIPRQELVNTVHRMICDTLQDVSQIEFRIKIVELGRAEQAVNSRCAFSAGIGRQFIVPEFWHAKSLSRTHFTHLLTKASSFPVNTSTMESLICSFAVRTERRIYFRVGWRLPKPVP